MMPQRAATFCAAAGLSSFAGPGGSEYSFQGNDPVVPRGLTGQLPGLFDDTKNFTTAYGSVLTAGYRAEKCAPGKIGRAHV